MNKKITVIGAGNVGATTAQRLFEKNYNEIALIDIACLLYTSPSPRD